MRRHGIRAWSWSGVILFAGFSTASLADVGATAGEFSVSATGAAQYAIRIWTPRGPAGIQPNIVLTYNSQLDTGLPGFGWSIGGLSSIERCSKTTPQDGAPSGINMTASDGYCLMSGPLGGRLRLTTGTYGAAGSVYQLEVADFSQVTAAGTGVGGPDHFVVKDKSGLIYEYGNTTTSKVLLPNSSATLRWMLNKVSDRAGNNYSISYNVANGWGNPNVISFGASSQNPSTYNYTLTFVYSPTDRSAKDSISGFTLGQTLSNRKLLTAIKIQSAGTTVRRYDFTPDVSVTTGATRLGKVTECADDNFSKCLTPTNFTYQDGQSGVAGGGTAGPASAPSLLKGKYDFNGDGKSDLLYASGGNWVVAFANGTGFDAAVSTTIPSTTAIVSERFLADGKDGVLANISNTWWYYSWNGASFSGTSTGTTAAAGPNLPADTNGDGRLDLVYSNGTSVFIRLNTTAVGATVPLFSTTATTAATLGGFDPTPGHGMIVIQGLFSTAPSGLRRFDFNQDGRQDVYATVRQTWDGFTTVKTLLGNGTTFTVSSGAYAAGSPWVNFNSDTCSDAVGFNLVYLSACNGSVATTVGYVNGGVAPLAVMDLDGDRRPDILVKNGTTVGVYFSTGTGLSSLTPTSIPYAATNSYFVFDQDGDGLDDLGVVSSTNAVTFYYHSGGGYVNFYAIQSPNLLSSVTDGRGINSTPFYVSTAQHNYTDGVPATNGLVAIPTPRTVVGQVTATNGDGTIYNRTYNYARGRSDSNRSNVFGFEEFKVTDNRKGLIAKTTYRVDFPYTGQVAEEDTYQPNGTSLMSAAIAELDKLDLATGASSRVFPYVKKSTARMYEVGGAADGNLVSESVTDFVVDNYGNITSATTKIRDKDAASPRYQEEYTRVATQHFDYSTAATNWCIGMPDQAAEQSTLPNTASLTLSTSAGVSGSGIDYPNCRVTQEISQPGDSTQEITTNYEYLPAGCGQQTKVSVVGKNPDGTAMPARDTSFGYGSRCQFLESITNAAGEISTVAFKPETGALSSATDANGLVTTRSSDDFGRMTGKVLPDGTAISLDRYKCSDTPSTCPSGSDISNWVKIVQLNTIPTRETRDFFDLVGRLRFSQVQNSAGVFVNEQHQTYDAMGGLKRLYEPSFIESGNYHEFDRDLRNRVTADTWHLASGATDRSVSYGYAGRTVTFHDARGYDRQRVGDVLGNIRQVIDPPPGGTTTYDYDPFGRTSLITDSAGRVINFQYNIYGVRTRLEHFTRGVWVYRPNSLGELVSYTDANHPGASVELATFQYDNLGRLTQRIEPEGTTAWTWGRAADNTAAHKYAGRLRGVTSPGGYAETYESDDKGRDQSATYRIDGTDYTYSYGYNGEGTLDKLTYPTTLGVAPLKLKFSYGYGLPTQIQDITTGVATTNYWTLNSADERGNAIDESLGNGVQVISGYDPLTGELIYRGSGNGGSTSNLESHGFEWDKNSNLYKRTDDIGNLTEIFENDPLNRLKGSTLNGVASLDISYNATGSMLSWQDSGSTAGPADFAATWTSFNQPLTLSSMGKSSQFWYDANHNRAKQLANFGGGNSETTTYIGGLLEKVETTSGTAYRHYIPAGNNIAIATRWNTGANPNYYLTTDHLGSTSDITDASGASLVHENFGAAGYRRGSNWTSAPGAPDYTQINNTTRQGFTGHEMLDNLSMVNMNGRIYAGTSFISPDPIIQDPYDSQSLNPYAYVRNRPLSAKDPSGFSDDWIPLPAPPIPNMPGYIPYDYCASHNCGYTGPGIMAGTSVMTMEPADKFGAVYSDVLAANGDETEDEKVQRAIGEAMGGLRCLEKTSIPIITGPSTPTVPMEVSVCEAAGLNRALNEWYSVYAFTGAMILTGRIGGAYVTRPTPMIEPPPPAPPLVPPPPAGSVTLAQSIESGLVTPGGRLAGILGKMESGYATAQPTTSLEAARVVQNAATQMNLDVGVARVAADGSISLTNVGGVVTTLGTDGSVAVTRGADVLLRLLPPH